MASVNKAIILGNLGKDPELRHTGGGTAVCNFPVATSKRYQDKGGEWQEKTEWHSIVVWGRQGENCAKYLAKGRTVYVEGRIKTREWQDKEGGKRYSTEIVANTVQFLRSGDGGSSSGNSGNARPPRDNGGDSSFSDDEIPF